MEITSVELAGTFNEAVVDVPATVQVSVAEVPYEDELATSNCQTGMPSRSTMQPGSLRIRSPLPRQIHLGGVIAFSVSRAYSNGFRVFWQSAASRKAESRFGETLT